MRVEYSRELIYLNNIPVYRREEEDMVSYTLFKDDPNGSVIRFPKGKGKGQELDYVYEFIQENVERPLQSIVCTIEYKTKIS